MTSPFRLTEKQREVNKLLGGQQRSTLVYGGARSGKTFILTRACVARALRGAHSRHIILRARMNAVRASVWLDTFPKVMRLCFPEVNWKSERQDGFVHFPNKSQLWFGGLDEKDRVEKILGQEYVTMYYNEASQIKYQSYLTASTRLAQVVPGLQQREYIDLNPSGTKHWTYRQNVQKLTNDGRRPLVDPDDYQFTMMNPKDNAANLDPKFIKTLENLPERARKRFLEGLYVSEIDGALFSLETLERTHVEPKEAPRMMRICVAVDPSGARSPEDKRNDAIGIVVAGMGEDGRGYILDDATCLGGPAMWGRIAVDKFYQWGADCIVAEINYGGAMVEHTIRTADPTVPYREVTASRGKWIRAEPVSALYEQDRVRHVGKFIDLEDELSNFSTIGYQGDKSPNRADAAIWALTELMPALNIDQSDPSIWERIGNQ